MQSKHVAADDVDPNKHLFLSYTSFSLELTIDLKPDCKFKFVSCLETYLKILSVWAMIGPCWALFTKSALRLASQGPFGGTFRGP